MTTVVLFISELRRRRVFRALAVYSTVAFVAVQGLVAVAPQFGWPVAWVRGGIIFVLALLPAVAVLSWAYDLTVQGLFRAEARTATPTDALPPWLAPSPWLALAGGLLLVVGAYNAWQLRTARSDDERVRIVVMPFANLTGQAEDQTLVDGLYDSVIGELGTNPNLIVPTRTAAVHLVATVVDPDKVAAELRAHYALEGGVRRAADHFELQVRLTDTHRERMLWQQTFNRPFGDALLVQRELADEVARVLWIAATPPALQSEARPVDPTAVRLYLEAREGYLANGLGSYKSVLVHIAKLDEAVAIDPGFALAWAFMARLHARVSDSFGLFPEFYRTHMPLARAAVTRAEGLDPNLVDAAVAWTYIAQHEGDYDLWLRAATRAVELNPSHFDANHRLVHALEQLQRWNEAFAMVERWIELEPGQPEWLQDLGDFHLAHLRYPEARAAYTRLLPMDDPLARERLDFVTRCEFGDILPGRSLDEFAAELDQNTGRPEYALYLERPKLAADLARRRYETRIARGDDPATMPAVTGDYAWALAEDGDLEGARRAMAPVIAKLSMIPFADLNPPRRADYHITLALNLAQGGADRDVVVAELDRAKALLRADDHSPRAEYSRRRIAAVYAFWLRDGASATAALRDAMRFPMNEGWYNFICPWSIWRNPYFFPIRDQAPFRELMKRHGVDVDKGLEDY
jgi:TolB-like protein